MKEDTHHPTSWSYYSQGTNNSVISTSQHVGGTTGGSTVAGRISRFSDDGGSKSTSQHEGRIRGGVVEQQAGKLVLETGTTSSMNQLIPNDLNTVCILNLAPGITEDILAKLFVVFGPIAGTEVVNRDELAARCGFVKFQNPHDAETARKAIESQQTASGMVPPQCLPMEIGSSPQRNISETPNNHPPPPPPADISQLPPAPSSLPDKPVSSSVIAAAFDRTDSPSSNTSVVVDSNEVHVQLPRSASKKRLIDLLSYFVVQEGHVFERAIMQGEKANEDYNFLFDTTDPDHLYYRWRVFASLQGDTFRLWRTEPFQMYNGGRWWHPPPSHDDSQKSSSTGILSNADERSGSVQQGNTLAAADENEVGADPLSEGDEKAFESLLRLLERSRKSIEAAMRFCLERANSSIVLAVNIAKWFTNQNLLSKISLIYLISDILHNSFSSKSFAWSFRSAFERVLPALMESSSLTYSQCPLMAAQMFATRIASVLDIWRKRAIYPEEYIDGLEAIFFAKESFLNNVRIEAVRPSQELRGDQFQQANVKRKRSHQDNSSQRVNKRLRWEAEGVSDGVTTTAIDEQGGPSSGGDSFETELDGHPVEAALFEELVNVPFWLRRNLMRWLRLKNDPSALEKLCASLGVRVRETAGGAGAIVDSDQLIRGLISRAFYLRKRDAAELAATERESAAVDVEESSEEILLAPRDIFPAAVKESPLQTTAAALSASTLLSDVTSILAPLSEHLSIIKERIQGLKSQAAGAINNTKLETGGGGGEVVSLQPSTAAVAATEIEKLEPLDDLFENGGGSPSASDDRHGEGLQQGQLQNSTASVPLNADGAGGDVNSSSAKGIALKLIESDDDDEDIFAASGDEEAPAPAPAAAAAVDDDGDKVQESNEARLRKSKVKAAEATLLEFRKSLISRKVLTDDEVNLRCDEKRQHLMNKVESEMLQAELNSTRI